MIRIIDGVAYEVTRSGSFKVKAHDLGNGHLEVSYRKQEVMSELDWSKGRIADHEDMMEKWRETHEEERRERSLKVAANRAKTRARKLCKANGVDTLMTLTYRFNELDLARCKADVKEFNRRMLRILPDFGCIAFFERQDRGAWHVHFGTARIPKFFHRVNSTGQKYKVKSFDVLRAVWRSVTKERQGTVNVKRSTKAGRSAARIASYIAKYIAKAFAEGEKGSNRWTKYGFTDVPKPVDLGTVVGGREALEVAFACIRTTHQVVTNFFSRFGDWGFFAVELESPSRKPLTEG